MSWFTGQQLHRHQPSRTRGAVLLMALLILSQVIVSSVGLGTLILNSLQQTRYIDNSIVAYYAAESGVEEALYELRRGGNLPESVTDPTTLHNNAFWTRDVADRESSLILDLPEDAFIEVDLYDPEDETVLPPDEQIATVRLSWPASACQPGECPNLVASVVSWDPVNFIAWSDESTTVQRISAGVAGAFINVMPNRLHRLRLRAENADFNGLVIEARNGDGDALDIPGRVVIDAWGQFNDAVQHIVVKTPRRAPLASLFDFALFSECSLVKGHPIRCP